MKKAFVIIIVATFANLAYPYTYISVNDENVTNLGEGNYEVIEGTSFTLNTVSDGGGIFEAHLGLTDCSENAAFYACLDPGQIIIAIYPGPYDGCFVSFSSLFSYPPPGTEPTTACINVQTNGGNGDTFEIQQFLSGCFCTVVDRMNFTIVSVVTLLSPNGGQILEAGTTTPITWSNEGTISNVKLEYSDDNGIDWTAIIASTPNDGTYSWTVPQLTSNQCLIRVSDAGDPAINDTSDTVFSAYVCQLNSIADLDTDCRVGIFELDLMTDNWLMSGSLADIVPPATVDFNDFAILAAEWLRVGNPFDVGYTEAPEGMAFIPSGQFQMGDSFSEGYSDELPVHAVYIDAFYMAKFETTNGQYCDYLNTALTQSLIEVRSGIVYAAPAGTDSYCNTNSSDSSSQIDYAGGVFTPMTKNSRGMSNDPAVCVSWFGATAYCNFNGYRLPTEAEWEYAARGGLAGKRYPWGDTIDGSMANYASSGDPYEVDPIPYTSPVGYYDGSQTPSEVDMANGYGLYDVTGNAWEWCNDWCDVNYYSISPYDNPTGPASSPDNWRILRGSSWSFSSADCRVAIRGVNTPDVRNSTCGFRTAKDIE